MRRRLLPLACVLLALALVQRDPLPAGMLGPVRSAEACATPVPDRTGPALGGCACRAGRGGCTPGPGDPWLPAGREQVHPADEATDGPEVLRLQPGDGGGVVSTRVRLSEDVAPAREIVAYDLGWLAPAPDDLWRAGPLMLQAVGWARWPPADTFLGISEEHRLVLVWQDEAAHEKIAELLEARAAAQRRSTPVRVTVHAEPARAYPRVLDLDVPGRGVVRSSQGWRGPYLCDYDVETQMEVRACEPIWCFDEWGVALTARAAQDSRQGGPDRLQLTLAMCAEAPRFEPRDVFLLGDRVRRTIEEPDSQATSIRLELPRQAGLRRAVDIGDGVRCEIEILGLASPPTGETHRVWRRLSWPPEPPRPTGKAVLSLELAGLASGLLGEGDLPLPLVPGSACALLRAEDPAWTGRSAGRSLPDLPWQVGVVALAVLDAEDASEPAWLDLQISAARWNGELRVVEILRDGRRRPTTVDLPTERAVVRTRRVALDEDGSGRLVFPADLGGGPEQFTLTIRRRLLD